MSISSPPKISVIIPVLNGERTIEKAIKSVIDQNYSNYELIILDGGSTDNTVNILQNYEQHITYWSSKRDGNACLAVNEGIQRATGDLVVGLMCDDYYEPEVFERISNALLDNPDADIISCGGRIIFFDEKSQRYRSKQVFATQRELELSFYNICFDVSAICCRFIKKSLFVKIGSYIPNDPNGKMPHSGDKEFLLRAVINNAKNITIDYIGHNYLAHPGSFTFSNNRETTVSLYKDHMWFAEMHLSNKTLTNEQRKILHYWYYHQSARLVFYYLYKWHFKEAWSQIRKDFPRYHIKWLKCFMFATPDFVWRKTIQKIKKIYNHHTGIDIIHGKIS
jgi:glycosyltransferase involved in cell wall biosynthesis